MEDLTGHQFGPYRITAPLGEGGMAAVYKAYQPSVDRYVAIKVLPQHFAKDQQFVQRFEREAKVLAKLQHPNILPVHDYGQSDGYTYIVMPMVEGGDLSELMQGKKLPHTDVMRIVSQVGDALDYAHAQGVVHRDIKPSNILLDPRGNCLLTDFGLAKMVAGASEKLTATGFVVGTPSYMAPEQGLGEPADGRSDIYALGVILYELLTGQVPFQAETPIAIVMKHIHDPLMPPREFQADISEAVERVILKALAKEPKDRFATTGEMVRALQAAMENGSSLVMVSTPEPVTHISKVKPLKKKSTVSSKPATTANSNGLLWWALGGVIAIIFVGVLGLGAWLLFRQNSEHSPAQAAPLPTQTTVPPTATPSQIELPTQAPLEPTPTATQVVPPTAAQQPTSPLQEPTVPLPPEQPAQPANDDPPARDEPPQEALQICQGQTVGSNCQFTAPLGDTIAGTCQQIRNQFACVPAGGPPPLR
ncbi:MAG: protein kinase [Anaerolineae bacterium]|nr:protein kinase [Anaerolineae bacterium]